MIRILLLLLLSFPALADQYQAYVGRVVDGDTIDCTIGLGFGITVQKRIRLEGIDAPETRTRDLEEKARGIQSAEWLKSQIEGKAVTLMTNGEGKYGRVIAVVIHEGTHINREMVILGLAQEMEY